MRAAYALTDLMIDALRRLDALPRALRWVLFFPAGIVCMLIVQGVLGAIYDAAGLSTSPEGMGGVSRAGLVSFTWALGVTLFPAVLSPRPWVVGVVMFALVLLVGVEPLYTMITTPYLRARLSSRAVVVAVWISAHALGGAVGLYLIRRLAARTNGVDAAPANQPGWALFNEELLLGFVDAERARRVAAVSDLRQMVARHREQGLSESDSVGVELVARLREAELKLQEWDALNRDDFRLDPAGEFLEGRTPRGKAALSGR